MSNYFCPLAKPGAVVVLDDTESHHLAVVLRKQIGDTVKVFDGNGNSFPAVVLHADKRKGVTLQIESVSNTITEPAVGLHLVYAPAKSMDRNEWLLEKITEIGVGRITPVVCNHSERRELKTERLQKVLIAACKQSNRSRIPTLDEMTPFNQFINSAESNANKLIAHASESSVPVASCIVADRPTVLLVGPEGDFSEQEIDLAIHKGFKPVSLGAKRLRLETAALYAAVVYNSICNS